MAAAVMVDDLRAHGLTDDDAQRVAEAMESIGAHATRWPTVGEVIAAMAPRPPREVNIDIDPPWLARLKHQWWQDNPHLLRHKDETMDEHALRLKTWCFSHGMARITGVHDERVPGEDDDVA